MTLRKLDYLEWLKNQEEFLLWQIDTLGGVPGNTKDEEEELQLVREIKELVKKYEGKDD